MPFVLLLVLTLTCLQRDWPAPPDWLGPLGSAVLPWGVVALFTVAAWMVAQYGCLVLRQDRLARATVSRRYGRFRRWHFYLLLAAHLLLVCFGGWGWLITNHMVLGDLVVPGIDLVLLAPLLTGMLASWAVYHPLDKTLAETALIPWAEPFPGRWAYLGLQCRNHFVLLAPPLILMLAQQLLLAALPGLQQHPVWLPVIGLGLLLAMYVGVPYLLRLFLGLQPLPPSPLRDRLMATAKRLRFTFNDILVWNTRYTVVNAMITGPLPCLRYVVVTDKMLAELTPEEIEAVFGHEVGHIKHHHLLIYFAFLMASLVAVVGVWNWAAEWYAGSWLEAWFAALMPETTRWLRDYEMLALLPMLGVVGVYIFVVFGFLSRRCERQADIYGCRTVSVEAFVGALEKVGILNGISRDRPGILMSWQHSTIARRIDFLRRMEVDPLVEPRFQRRLGLVKWGLALALAGILLALGPQQVWAVLGKLGN